MCAFSVTLGRRHTGNNGKKVVLVIFICNQVLKPFRRCPLFVLLFCALIFHVCCLSTNGLLDAFINFWLLIFGKFNVKSKDRRDKNI